MKKAIILFLAVVCLSHVCFADQPVLPAELAEKLASTDAKAVVMVSTSCVLGRETIPAYGLLIRSGSLKPAIAYWTRSGWHISFPATDIRNSKGRIADFLSSFRKMPNAGESYDIRCVAPLDDPTISTHANGEFVTSFARHLPPDSKYMCFQADDTYNDWACYTSGSKARAIVLSFVQINGD